MTSHSLTPLNSARHIHHRAPDPAIVLTTVACTVASAVEAAAYLALAHAVTGDGSPTEVLLAAAVSLLVTVLGAHVSFLGAARYAGRLYAALGEGLIHARLGWFTTRARALVTAAAGRSVPELMALPAHHLQVIVPAVVIPPVLVGGIWFLVSPGAASLVSASLMCSLILHLWSQRGLVRADADRSAAETEAGAASLRLVDHLGLAVTTVGPSRTLAALDPVWRTQAQTLDRTTRATVPTGVVASVASRLPVVGALVWLLSATPTPHDALALVLLSLRAGTPLSDLALVGLTLGSLRSARRTLDEIVHAPQLDGATGVPPVASATDADTPAQSGSGLSLRDLAPGGGQDTVTATIAPGTVVRLSGPSGSGKTTLLGLLLRFEDPGSGSITVDGTPLPSIPYPLLASRFAYVPQEPTLFSGTLAENVTMGTAAADTALATALRVADLDEVVARHPDGADQDIGSRGAALSGGEQQRVALARAVHRILSTDADLLLLDEPTSALDEATATRVIDGLAALHRDLSRTADRRLTVVVVSHRDSEDWNEDAVIRLG